MTLLDCRPETKNMFCMLCSEIQPAAQVCRSCHETVARYYCDTCKLWDDRSEKSIYHCDQCGICRVGKGLGQDYFHCEKCNICMVISLKDNHRCIERSLECDCPICGEYMFTSTSKIVFEVQLSLVFICFEMCQMSNCDHSWFRIVAIVFMKNVMTNTSKHRTSAPLV
jgi:hypothetical protein